MVAELLFAMAPAGVLALDPDHVFSKYAKVLSAESTLTHFGSRLNDGNNIVQAWNLAARFSLLPFGTTRFKYFDGALDGSLEVGLKPTFERFDTVGQNFAGVGLELRYYLLHFRYGRWVPWIDASIAPGGVLVIIDVGRIVHAAGKDVPGVPQIF